MSESESLSGGIRPPEGKAEIIETNYRVGAQNVKTRLGRWGMDFHNPVFIVSAVAVVLFVAYALVFQDQASSFFGWLRPALTSTFDAFFLWSANIFVLFCLALVVSPWGGCAPWRIRGEAGFWLCRLVCHAVCRGNGHWFDVLWGA